ncbi:3 beta-hydroxysteroid dehydrogenase type 7 [Electrophorus electricus]|uniref:3-beta hydroxysteroid dehydrogenase/isomerase domain-containing protein n=1 Tax=Electrophorus electricus TaxID=8005 RepID=A0A4W4FUU5_ELEEL|nr:3 beta-hydroxysteroid dehydrogenase type 7 [Electrophorus electricus]XP_026871512.2 3 beta-hydroxysteroid dehydrogenase type 7 [Electrophorus electricus]XP_026871513.2 3 beta-hydroxysteroid dehydrogenase type 7 [Electrophorus electricus]XP_035386332.1 3 beta-hydroxysteroid dehydrogenase type 7 [Electrophorus electricus]
MSGEESRLVYVITGGCGFLGQHLLRVLLEKEDQIKEIRLFDKHIDSDLHSYTTEHIKVVLTQGDITDYQSVLEACRGADLVVHAASLVDVWYRVPERTIYAVNVEGTKNVLSACVELGIQHLIYTSSMEVVGPNVKGDTFIRGDEDTPYNVIHEMPYPRSKAAAENLVLQANGTKIKGGGTLYTCALRPTGIYGENHQLMKEFYQMGVRTGGWLMRGVPRDTEHGRVYAGNVAWMHLLAARALRRHPERLGGEVYFCYDDSPYKSYEDFNMQFLSAFNFRVVQMPFCVLWFIACLNDLLHWLLQPLCKFTPLLNRYTLAVARTSFTVHSDKAQRHFQYRPLYSWEQCHARTQSWVDTFPHDTSAKDM